jgi:hypothetical protein
VARHAVRNVQKDDEGNITFIGARGTWRMSSDYAIRQLRSASGDRFYVPWKDQDPVEVIVVDDESEPYLRTARDNDKGNNLDSLPSLW